MSRFDLESFLAPPAPAAAADRVGTAEDSLVAARRRLIEDSVRALPPLPGALGDLLRASTDQEFEIPDLEKRVSRDPVLVTRILRLANSAFYSPRSEICSVGAAMMMLGMRATRNILVASYLRAALGSAARRPGFPAQEVLRHSVGTAIGCARLGRVLPRLDALSDSLFVAGLLHDIGIVALADLYRPHAKTLWSRGIEGLDPAAERGLFGLDHAEAGALVHAQWKLPAPLLGALARHHEPPEALAGDPLALATVLADEHEALSRQTPPEEPAEDSRAAACLRILDADPRLLTAVSAGYRREVDAWMGCVT